MTITIATPLGVRLCRPSGAVLAVLPNLHLGRFVTENGEIIDAG